MLSQPSAAISLEKEHGIWLVSNDQNGIWHLCRSDQHLFVWDDTDWHLQLIGTNTWPKRRLEKNPSLALALCSILHLPSGSFLLQSLEHIMIARDRYDETSLQSCLLIQDIDLCFNATET